VHQQAFAKQGISAAFERVIALVVQPGVEFGHTDVHHFAPPAAEQLTASLSSMPGQVFEAHSTDYQTSESLAALVRGGFSILKVGPWLTFALREALYGLDAIADVMDGKPPSNTLMVEMEKIMSERPEQWNKYYTGFQTELWLQRHFSYSDRIRYYWPEPAARAAADTVLERLHGRTIPATLLSQYLPTVNSNTAEEIVVEAVLNVLYQYDAACHPVGS